MPMPSRQAIASIPMAMPACYSRDMDDAALTAFSFRIAATDGTGRSGVIDTPHGTVRTPAFMPVGTQGAMKGVHWRDVKASGAEIVLGNTYHLMLRPGAEEIAALGGLHKF